MEQSYCAPITKCYRGRPTAYTTLENNITKYWYVLSIYHHPLDWGLLLSQRGGCCCRSCRLRPESGKRWSGNQISSKQSRSVNKLSKCFQFVLSFLMSLHFIRIRCSARSRVWYWAQTWKETGNGKKWQQTVWFLPSPQNTHSVQRFVKTFVNNTKEYMLFTNIIHVI